MQERKIQVFVSFLLVIATQANPTSIFHNGIEYLLYRFDDQTGRLSFNDANAACVNISGELAIINDVEIQNAIQPLLLPDTGPTSWAMGYWIGGYCSDNCKVGSGGSTSNQVNWKWGDGSGMYDGYTNWYSTLEPGGISNTAAYVYNFDDMWGYPNTFGTWGDDDVNNPKNYICQRDTACYPNPCYNGGTCQYMNNGSYTCYCAPGFDDINCTTDLCNPSPCQNGGTCIGTDGGYECDCTLGVIGTNCEIDLCSRNPCENGGTCIGTDGGYECDCTLGIIGTNCEIGLCSRNPCENGGTCIGTEGAYECKCLDGFIGTFCEKELCRNSTCKNGGTCIQTSSEVKCDCQSGYIGSRCGIDLCIPNPCQNNGTCIGINGGYNCSCPEGFNGTICETDICDLVTCHNEGTCHHAAVTGFVCECKKGYKGTTCQIDPCFNHTCENNATCFISNYTSLCNCKDGYEGDNCELIIVETVDNTWIPIVAGTLGGVALLVIIAVIVYCCLKQRMKPDSKDLKTNKDNNNISNVSTEAPGQPTMNTDVGPDIYYNVHTYANIAQTTDEGDYVTLS